jgi:hypothetical protein
MEEAFLQFGLGTRHGVRSTLTQMIGRPGTGTCRLELTLEWTPTDWEQLHDARLLVAGDLEISFAQDVRTPLAQLQGIYAVAFPSRAQGTFPARVELGANLLPAQIEALERERAGGPLNLHLRLQGVVLRNRPPDRTGKAIVQVERPTAAQIDPATEVFSGELVYRLKATEWIEVLEHWRYAQGFLLQVPKFTNRDTARAVRASDDLEQAIKDMTEGRYREAVAACRDALETAYGIEDKDCHPELEYSVKGMQGADKQARFWLARRGVWAIANAAKHRDETTRDIEWERRDAQALILMLSALLEQDPPL